MTEKRLQQMVRTFEYVKYGVKSDSEAGKKADGLFQLKNRTYYMVKFSVNIGNYAIYALILWGLIRLFI